MVLSLDPDHVFVDGDMTINIFLYHINIESFCNY